MGYYEGDKLMKHVALFRLEALDEALQAVMRGERWPGDVEVFCNPADRRMVHFTIRSLAHHYGLGRRLRCRTVGPGELVVWLVSPAEVSPKDVPSAAGSPAEVYILKEEGLLEDLLGEVDEDA